MTNKVIIALMVIVSLVVLYVGIKILQHRTYAHSGKVESEKVRFFDDIESYMSLAQFTDLMKAKGLVWRYNDSSPTLKDKSVRELEKLDIVDIELDGYNLWGCEGKIEVEFFKNRLVSLDYFPLDSEAFKKAMKLNISAPIEWMPPGDEYKEVEEYTIGENLIVYAGRYFSEERYLGFCDERLRKQLHAWIHWSKRPKSGVLDMFNINLAGIPG